MIRSANHSSYPRGDDDPGAIETTIAMCVAEQSRAFIDIVTEGMIRWDGPVSFLATGLDGVETGDPQPWFQTDLRDARLVVTGDVVRRGPFLVEDVETALGVAQAPLKVALPGPALLARLADDRHYGDADRLADALAAALGAEVAALREAGATVFQLDESLLCRHPEDLDRVARTAAAVFDQAGPDVTTIVATSFGALTDVADRLAEIPGTHLGLDMCAAGSWELLGRLPAGRGVALGLFDATRVEQEDAADVASRLEPHRNALADRDLIVGPNAGLAALPRDEAFEKLLHARYLVEALTAKGSSWV